MPSRPSPLPGRAGRPLAPLPRTPLSTPRLSPCHRRSAPHHRRKKCHRRPRRRPACGASAAWCRRRQRAAAACGRGPARKQAEQAQRAKSEDFSVYRAAAATLEGTTVAESHPAAAPLAACERRQGRWIVVAVVFAGLRARRDNQVEAWPKRTWNNKAHHREEPDERDTRRRSAHRVRIGLDVLLPRAPAPLPRVPVLLSPFLAIVELPSLLPALQLGGLHVLCDLKPLPVELLNVAAQVARLSSFGENARDALLEPARRAAPLLCLRSHLHLEDLRGSCTDIGRSASLAESWRVSKEKGKCADRGAHPAFRPSALHSEKLLHAHGRGVLGCASKQRDESCAFAVWVLSQEWREKDATQLLAPPPRFANAAHTSHRWSCCARRG